MTDKILTTLTVLGVAAVVACIPAAGLVGLAVAESAASPAPAAPAAAQHDPAITAQLDALLAEIRAIKIPETPVVSLPDTTALPGPVTIAPPVATPADLPLTTGQPAFTITRRQAWTPPAPYTQGDFAVEAQVKLYLSRRLLLAATRRYKRRMPGRFRTR